MNQNDNKEMYLTDQPPVSAPTQLYVTAIYNQFAGLRDEALADLQTLLNNPVGVGDHENIGESIKKKLEEVDKYDSLASTIEKYMLSKHNANNTKSSTNERQSSKKT